MAQTATITLTSAGTDTGPFDLYTDVDAYAAPYESGVSKAALIGGYVSTTIPDAATIVRVQSTGVCTNYIDLNLVTSTTTTTTSTSTSTSTTTSTTTTPPTTTTTTTLPNFPLEGLLTTSVALNAWTARFEGLINRNLPLTNAAPTNSGSFGYIATVVGRAQKTADTGNGVGFTTEPTTVLFKRNGVTEPGLGTQTFATPGLDVSNVSYTYTLLDPGDTLSIEINEG